MRTSSDDRLDDETGTTTDDPYDENRFIPTFPYAWGGGWGPGWLPGTEREERSDEIARDEPATADDDSWLDEGLIGLLLVTGVVLFLFPEPSTSALGILLIVTGLIGWAIDAVVG